MPYYFIPYHMITHQSAAVRCSLPDFKGRLGKLQKKNKSWSSKDVRYCPGVYVTRRPLTSQLGKRSSCLKLGATQRWVSSFFPLLLKRSLFQPKKSHDFLRPKKAYSFLYFCGLSLQNISLMSCNSKVHKSLLLICNLYFLHNHVHFLITYFLGLWFSFSYHLVILVLALYFVNY